MNFKKFLQESKEHQVVQVRALEKVELKRVSDIKEIITIIHDYLGKKDLSIEEIKDLSSKMNRFSKYKFLTKFISELEEGLSSYHKMMSASTNYTAKQLLSASHKNLKAAFLSSDKSKIRQHSQVVNQHLADIDHSIDLPGEVKRLVKRNFTAETSIFGTMELLNNIGQDEYIKIKNIDLSKSLYTGMNFPVTKSDDFHYVISYMLQLSNSPKNYRITNDTDFRIHTKVSNSNNPALEKLLKLTDRYLHSNERELIPQIKSLIDSIPSVKAANEKAKKKLKIVYRGVGFGEDEYTSENEVIKEEKNRKFVATSTSKRAAKNFALSIGHMESEEDRRSGHGYLITYEVTAQSVILDTSVIDTAYNESEILIDATKASIKEIESV